jgi:2'-5' RNA ligase
LDVSSKRLFLAINLPGPVRDPLLALCEPLPGANWSRPETLHLTLRFIGDVPEEMIPEITRQLGTVRVEPFLLPIEGVGAYPPKGAPRVLWSGVGPGHPRLFQLRQQLDDALLAAGLPLLDVRTFHPHVTLARCATKGGPALTRWMDLHQHFAAPPFRVNAFELYASEPQPGGAVHTSVQRFPLRK